MQENVISWEECALLCNQTVACSFFTFQPESAFKNACWMMEVSCLHCTFFDFDPSSLLLLLSVSSSFCHVKDCEPVQRILHLLQPAWWMILTLSVAPKLAWHRDQSRCDLARNQEFSMKISFFQIPICGQPPGNFAKQNAHRTRLVRCSTGSRTKVDA